MVLNRNFELALRTGPPRNTETSAQCLYQDGHFTQSMRSDQAVFGVAAISMMFCAKTDDPAGAHPFGQIMRGSGICALSVMEASPISGGRAMSVAQARTFNIAHHPPPGWVVFDTFDSKRQLVRKWPKRPACGSAHRTSLSGHERRQIASAPWLHRLMYPRRR